MRIEEGNRVLRFSFFTPRSSLSLEEDTIYGELHLERDGKIVQVDSRPSDAIAIALRLDAPIFAAEALLMRADEEESEESESYGVPESPAPDSTELSADQLKQYLEQLRPEDFGKFKL